MIKSKPLITPYRLKKSYPLAEEDKLFVSRQRETIQKIIAKKDEKILIIAGPCSIHDTLSTLEFAKNLQSLSNKLGKNFQIVLRTCFEKPRSTIGWNGLIYDPFLQDKENIHEGLFKARKLLSTLTKMQIPCAMEILNPLIIPYLSDLISYGWIGARTAASSSHRQVSSSLPFPVGFKNTIDGNIDIALQGAYSASCPHDYVGLDEKGKSAIFSSSGNPYSHIILRGSQNSSNFDPISIQRTLEKFKHYPLYRSLIVDCSHGNSQKNLEKQKISFRSVIEQISEKNLAICGIMLESHLESGSQNIQSPLLYGVSITDPCLSFDELKQLLLFANDLIKNKAVYKASI